MSIITKQDTDGVKGLLLKGELGFDDYVLGGDTGRVYVGTGGANIPLARKDEIVASVDTIADMVAYDVTQAKTLNVKGYTTINDGGGGTFNYDATQSGTNNGGTIINGWVRQYSGGINPLWFGADGTGVSISTSVFASIINASTAFDDIEIYLPDGANFRANLNDASIDKESKLIRFTGNGRVGAFNSSEIGTGRQWDNDGIFNHEETSGIINSIDTNDTSYTLKQFSTAYNDAGGSSCTATATIVAGVITGFTIIDGGSNYVLPPRVIIAGDGTGASATAVLTSGSVTSITIDSGGTNYTDASTEIYVHNGPVVVVTGDSLSTPNPTGSFSNENQWSIIQREITKQNPSKSILFINRAIGGETWTGFNQVASNAQAQVDWYGDATKPWLDYIEDIQPDLIIAGFGMNDRQNFVQAQMVSAITTMILFTKTPDIYLVTNMISSNLTSDTTKSGYEAQEGRNFVAEFMRSFALEYKLGLIDLNRQFNLVRDGIDVTRSAFVNGEASPAVVGGVYTSNQLSRDFMFDVTLSSDLLTTEVITCDASFIGVNGRSFIEISDNSGKLNVSLYMSVTSTRVDLFNIKTLEDTPTTGDNIRIVYKDNRVIVYINSIQVFNKWSYNHGGLYYPKIVSSLGGAYTLNSVANSKFIKYSPRLTDHEIYGSTSSRYEGNLINHPSSLGVEYIMKPTFEAIDFKAPIFTKNSLSSNSAKFGVNIHTPLANLHVGGTEPLGSGVIPNNDANTLFVEAQKAGMTLMSKTGNNVQIQTGDETNSKRFQQIFLNGLSKSRQSINNVTVQELTSDRIINYQPMRVAVYTMATLPTAASRAGDIIMVSDTAHANNYAMCYSNGSSNWYRVDDNTIVV